METTTQNIEKSTFGDYTIAKDFEKFTVLITKPSPRSRLGLKVVHHYSFRRSDISASIMQMNRFVDKFIETTTNEEAEKAAKKLALQNARKEFTNPYTIGQILYNTWGYDQTNVNFYQIVAVKGKTVVVRELAQKRNEDGFMSGKTMAVKDSFVGDEITKIVQIRIWNGQTSISINDLSNWDGRPVGYSSYH